MAARLKPRSRPQRPAPAFFEIGTIRGWVYLNPDTGRFNRLDPWSGSTSDPQSLHKYAYVHCDPVNGVDPTGNFNIIETTFSAVKQFSIRTFYLASAYAFRLSGPVTKVINTVYPWFVVGTVALAGLDAGTKALLKNTEPVPMGNGPRGVFVETRYGVNLGGNYPTIDDWQPQTGLATQVKSRSRATIQSYLSVIETDAQSLVDIEKKRLQGKASELNGGRTVTIRPGQIKYKALVVAVPENQVGLFQKPEVRRTLERISNTTGTMIRIVPVKGWRR